MTKKKKICLIALSVILLAGVGVGVYFYLAFNGKIILNNPSMATYPVRGVDVSSYQGNIDWDVLSSQNLSFAFIKATEGSSHVDSYFSYNYEAAIKSGLRVSPYHFFSFESEGKTQAENYIRTVEKKANMLPPSIDFEFYVGMSRPLPPVDETRKQLSVLLRMLEDHYGLKPIIYATRRSFSAYLEGYFDDYDFWMRDIYFEPSSPWKFWQYTNRGLLKGYTGKEKYIDMNVFSGTMSDFKRYPSCSNNEE